MPLRSPSVRMAALRSTESETPGAAGLGSALPVLLAPASRGCTKARLVWFGVSLLLGASLAGAAPIAAGAVEAPYWLQFGKPAQTCPGSGGETPFKVQGASWGVLASGVVVCRETGDSYVYDIQFLNVLVDPLDKKLITRDALDFDWCGLALFRPSPQGTDIDWLYDHSVPIKGELRKNSTGRIVFGNISFTVPKAKADAATNMIFYITFDGPLVVINAV